MAGYTTSSIYTQERLFFIKLLFRWSGSVWQLLWVDYLVYVSLYILLAVIYQNVLRDQLQLKQTFEAMVLWLGLIRTSVPLSFMLGFFVSTVITRWWSIVSSIPWMYTPSFVCQAILDTSKMKQSDIARKMRITLLRYMNLSWILVMAEISAHIKERFGFWRLERKRYKLTWQKRLQMIDQDSKVQKYFGSLVTESEINAFGRAAQLSNDTDESYSPESWLPLVWATRMLRRARNIGCIADDRQTLFLIEMITKFRGDLGTQYMYNDFNIPLVYVQVAVAAVYIFLLSTLMSTQLTDSNLLTLTTQSASVNGTQVAPTALQFLAYFPVIGSLEFVFYLGWFKIGVCLLNSLGKDKADIPMSDILNQNLKASVKIGGAENTIFPDGLTDNGQPEEQQMAEFLESFDFNGVHAHDKFMSAEETSKQLKQQLMKRWKVSNSAGSSKESSGISTPSLNYKYKKDKKDKKDKKENGFLKLATPSFNRSVSLMWPRKNHSTTELDRISDTSSHCAPDNASKDDSFVVKVELVNDEDENSKL